MDHTPSYVRGPGRGRGRRRCKAPQPAASLLRRRAGDHRHVAGASDGRQGPHTAEEAGFASRRATHHGAGMRRCGRAHLVRRQAAHQLLAGLHDARQRDRAAEVQPGVVHLRVSARSAAQPGRCRKGEAGLAKAEAKAEDADRWEGVCVCVNRGRGGERAGRQAGRQAGRRVGGRAGNQAGG